MENLYSKIEKLNCKLHDNGNEYSVYSSNKHSIQQVICEVVNKLNSVIDVVDEYTNIIKSFLQWVQDEGITNEVKIYLDEMLLNGSLAEIINVTIFEDLNNKIASIEEKIYNLIDVYSDGRLDDFINNSKSNTVEINKDITQDNIVINRSNVKIIIKSNISTNTFTINGSNTGIEFTGGKITGDLIYSTTTRVTPLGSNIIYFDGGHRFNVGDLVATSYGLGGDGKNHAKILSVTNNSITVDKITHNELPIGVPVGNFTWSSLLVLNGYNTYCYNVNLDNARGYAISTKNECYFDNGKITNVGLDMGLLETGKCIFNNVYFGNVIDCAKSGLVLRGCDVELNNCVFDKDNSDADFVIQTYNSPSSIHASKCKFTNKNTHVAPYNYNKFALISVQAQQNTDALKNCVFVDCEIESTIHGLFHKGNDGYKPNCGIIHFIRCKINDGIGEIRYIAMDNMTFDLCKFHDVITGGKVFVLNDSNNINVYNSIFENISSDFTTVFNSYDCVFNNVSNIKISNLVMKNPYIKGSQLSCVNSYLGNNKMVVDGLIIDNEELQVLNHGGNIESVINLNQDNTILEFKYPNDIQKCLCLKHNNRTYYNTQMVTAYGKNPIFSKYNYILTNDSFILDVTSNVYRKVVNSKKRTISSVNGSAIYLDTTTLQQGDLINIKLNDGIVKTYTISSVNDGYVNCSENIDSNYTPVICCYRLS